MVIEKEQLLALLDQQFPDLSPREKQFFSSFSDEDHEKLYAYAYELYRNGKYRESAQFFRFLTVLNGFDRRIWIGLGASYQMLKQYVQAIGCYSVAAVQNPDDPLVHRYAADCFFAMGNFSKAIEALSSSIAMAQKQNDAVLVSRLQLLLNSWRQKETI